MFLSCLCCRSFLMLKIILSSVCFVHCRQRALSCRHTCRLQTCQARRRTMDKEPNKQLWCLRLTLKLSSYGQMKESYRYNILCMVDILEHYYGVACDAIRSGSIRRSNTDPASGTMSALTTPATSMFRRRYRLFKLYSIMTSIGDGLQI